MEFLKANVATNHTQIRYGHKGMSANLRNFERLQATPSFKNLKFSQGIAEITT